MDRGEEAAGKFLKNEDWPKRNLGWPGEMTVEGAEVDRLPACQRSASEFRVDRYDRSFLGLPKPKVSASINATPRVMAESAMLKAGQCQSR
jgi:hypothetical protein